MTDEARYVIGLDIGDGESCLGWAPLDRPGETLIYARPRTAERSIVTAMAQPPAGTVHRLIGDEAVTSPGATHISVSFKRAPDALGTGIPDAVLFAQSLLLEFREQHPEVFRDATVCVGHPAGWPPEAVAAYDRHLALLGLPVRLVPESQSALLHVRDRGRAESELERVLVVDIGSSTTDFTVVEDLTPRNLPVGAAVGCRQIDEWLAGRVRSALRHDTALSAALAVDGGPALLLLACRWAKEAQFSGESRRIMNLRESCDERFRPIVATAWTWLLDLDITHMLTEPGGWGDDFRAVLAEVAALLGDRHPTLVVLTGGGSRIPLAGRLCHEIFPAAAVEQDEEPAFAVARGLVSNGRRRAEVRRFRQDVADLMRAPETEAKVRTEAVLALDGMKDKIAEQVLEARESSADLANHIKFGMFDAKLALAESLAFYLSMRVERICRRYGVPAHRVHLELNLPDLFTAQLDRILDRVGKAERLTEFSTPAGLAQFAAPQNVAHHLVSSALERVRARFAPALTPEVAAFAIGAVTTGSGFAADRAARTFIQRMLRLGEYSPDELDQITADVLKAITEQTDDRARELERWLA
ncbi:Hsp70 family protein [Actinoplanes rectilineatus]|uniref:Hsp70 family protein n=1 Tax=Actinoplanes rectilineatus TaxID=113571 RepID=UPI0005F28D3F|nr:hypothetical protein [Actinoplanes rectilineatus]